MHKILFLLFIPLLSSCLLRTDDFMSQGQLVQEMDEYEKIKKEYINVNSWDLSDTDAGINNIITQLENSDNFKQLIKQRKGKIRIKIGSFTDMTKEEGFPMEDVKNELLSRLGQNPNIILIEKEDNDSLIKEIAYQHDGAVRKNDIKNIGNQSGADLLLFGNINMSKAMKTDTLTKNYYLTIKMTDIETGVKSFMSVYKVQKKYTVE